MGEGNNFASVCTSIHSGVPTLAGGTYPGFFGENLPGGSPSSGLRVPILARGTYPDLGTYLCWGVPTLAIGEVPTLSRGYLPWLGSNVKLSTKCQLIKKMSSCQK